MKSNKKTKKVLNVILYITCFLFFGTALFGTIIRFTKGELYVFGNRFDVVLTDSMSSKHEDHIDFLEGHNDQYQKMDLVISHKVTKPRDINLYDVVIFNDRLLGNNMHRIVDMIEDSNNTLTLTNVLKNGDSTHKGLLFNKIDSSLVTNSIVFDRFEMSIFTSLDDYDSHYNFNVNGTDFIPKIHKKAVSNGYIIKYSFQRDTRDPGTLTIAHHKEFDYSKDIITNISLNALYEDIIVNYDSEVIVDNNITTLVFNQTYLYEIRGDKQKTGEIYSLKDIKSKVIGKIPKGGYFARYISSIWGVIMLFGIGIGFLVVEIMLDKVAKAKSDNNCEATEQSQNLVNDNSVEKEEQKNE